MVSYRGKDFTEGMDRYDLGLTTPGSQFPIKAVSCVPVLLSESKVRCSCFVFNGAVLFMAAFGLGGFFGGIRCVLRPIKGDISKLLPLKQKC